MMTMTMMVVIVIMNKRLNEVGGSPQTADTAELPGEQLRAPL